MSTSCNGLRQLFEECLAKSDCMAVEGKSGNECAKWSETGVDQKCRGIQKSLFDCKRGMLDQRNRFRGNKGF